MNTQEKIDVLKRARKLIEKPEHWGKESFAKDAEGEAVPVHSRKAVCFCAVGALIRANPIGGLLQNGAVKELAAGLGTGRYLDTTKIFNWNDSATHEQMLAHFDATIARLEQSLAQ